MLEGDQEWPDERIELTELGIAVGAQRDKGQPMEIAILIAQLHMWMKALPSVPESISCEMCGNHADSIDGAIAAGWKDIEPDDGLNWNYLGKCPDCQLGPES